jgi:hypothetical protein
LPARASLPPMMPPMGPVPITRMRSLIYSSFEQRQHMR